MGGRVCEVLVVLGGFPSRVIRFFFGDSPSFNLPWADHCASMSPKAKYVTTRRGGPMSIGDLFWCIPRLRRALGLVPWASGAEAPENTRI